MFITRRPPYGYYALFFFLGATVGAGVALLFAPTTGRKLQKQLRDVLEDQVENVVEKGKSAIKKVVA